MVVIVNLLSAFATIIDIILTIYMFLIIARALISWVNPDPYNPIVKFLYQTTEPVLYQVRRYMPFRGMAIDISPIIVLFIIVFLRQFLVVTINDIILRLK